MSVVIKTLIYFEISRTSTAHSPRIVLSQSPLGYNKIALFVLRSRRQINIKIEVDASMLIWSCVHVINIQNTRHW